MCLGYFYCGCDDVTDLHKQLKLVACLYSFANRQTKKTQIQEIARSREACDVFVYTNKRTERIIRRKSQLSVLSNCIYVIIIETNY